MFGQRLLRARPNVAYQARRVDQQKLLGNEVTGCPTDLDTLGLGFSGGGR